MNDGAASARMAQLKAELNNTWFAWSGSTSFKTGKNIAAYYPIQGPHLVIENAPQDDEPANHIHTILGFRSRSALWSFLYREGV